VVDFERRGPVVIPGAYLAKAIRPGVTGILAHSYALTSHAAQGETYESGRHLATDRSSRGGVYVGLSRGRSDARLYAVRRRDLACGLDEEPELPRLENLHFHDLRHVANTMAAATGASLKELMYRMGHASPAAALRYQHATQERDGAIAEALGALITAAPPAAERAAVRQLPSDQ